MLATFISLLAAGSAICAGISLQTSSKPVLISFNAKQQQTTKLLHSAGLRILRDPAFSDSFIVTDTVSGGKLPVAYIEFTPSGKISGVENIIPTSTIGDAKNLIYQLAEKYRGQIGKNDVIQHDSGGAQYKVFYSCGKLEIQVVLSISYDSKTRQNYVSVKTLL